MSGTRQTLLEAAARIVMGTVMAICLAVLAGCTGNDDASPSPVAPSPSAHATVGTITHVDGIIGDLAMDECLQPIDAHLVDGKLQPPQPGFEAATPGGAFRLERMLLAAFGPCNPDAGKLVLRTIWSDPATGLLLSVDQEQRTFAQTDGSIGMTNALFESDGSSFYLQTAHDMVVDDSGRGGPKSVSATPDAKDLALQQRVLKDAVAGLVPAAVQDCLATDRAGNSWADLASQGVHDPASAIPSAYKPIEFQLTFTDYPACHTGPRQRPAFQLQAKWHGPGNRLLSVDLNALIADNPDPVLQDEPERFQWANAKWAGDVAGDAGIAVRDIARAIDPTAGTQCGRGSRNATFEDLAAWHIQDIAPPEGYQIEATPQGTIFGPSDGCNGPDAGARVEWMFTPVDIAQSHGNLVLAGAFTGHQYFMPPPDLSSAYSIYWKGEDGVQYYVTGYKWGNVAGSAFELPAARPVMLAVARELDPAFAESKLETPPAYADLYEP